MTDRIAPPEDGDEWLSLRALPEDAGQRLDSFVTTRVEGVGRKLAARLCARGAVRLNGRRAKKGESVPAEATVTVQLSAWGEAQPAPDLALNVALESDDLVVVDKQAGVPTGAIVGRETNTLAGALIARYPEMAKVGFSRREPGVAHRLDNQTSGLIVAARSAAVFDALRAAFSAGAVQKKYLALVDAGSLTDEGSIFAPLHHSPSDPRRVVVVEAGQGKDCRTDYRVIRRGEESDLVELSVSSAFRHQIRAHLSHVGAPLWGDEVYGGRREPLSPRHALHASYITCSAEGLEAFEVTSALPPDLKALAPGEE